MPLKAPTETTDLVYKNPVWPDGQNSGFPLHHMEFFLELAGITGNADVLTDFLVGFACQIMRVDFWVMTVVTTAADLATIGLEIGSTAVTGGVVALTSANCTPVGAVVAGTAVTAANVMTATDTLTIVSSSVTAFAEGTGRLIVTLSPDLVASPPA